MKSTVLITTAIAPPVGMPYLKITNVATRHLTTKAAIYFWAAQGVEKIVVADATGKTPLNGEELEMLEKMDVQVEQLAYFQNDALIKSKGKGYGEGELIKFALANSNFLQGAEGFFKCTGKVYCRNFKAIFQLIEGNHIQHMFWRWLEPGDFLRTWADVRFFYSTKEFCEKHLIPAYLSSDDNAEATEFSVFSMLQQVLPAATALRPLLSGFCGGSGEQYFDASLGILDTTHPCWASK
jgi:hypothetical protein